jgi:hypothetical protein
MVQDETPTLHYMLVTTTGNRHPMQIFAKPTRIPQFEYIIRDNIALNFPASKISSYIDESFQSPFFD